jgi:hypothetical protein
MKRNLKQMTMPGQRPTVSSPNNITDTMNMRQNGMSWSNIWNSNIKSSNLSKEQIWGLVGGAGGGLLLSHLFSGRKKRGLLGTILWGGLGALAGYMGAKYLPGMLPVKAEGSMDDKADHPDRDPKNPTTNMSPEEYRQHQHELFKQELNKTPTAEVQADLEEYRHSLILPKDPGALVPFIPNTQLEDISVLADTDHIKNEEIKQIYADSMGMALRNNSISQDQTKALENMGAILYDRDGKPFYDSEEVENGRIKPEVQAQYQENLQAVLEQEISEYDNWLRPTDTVVSGELGGVALQNMNQLAHKLETLEAMGHVTPEVRQGLRAKAIDTQVRYLQMQNAGAFSFEEDVVAEGRNRFQQSLDKEYQSYAQQPEFSFTHDENEDIVKTRAGDAAFLPALQGGVLNMSGMLGSMGLGMALPDMDPKYHTPLAVGSSLAATASWAAWDLSKKQPIAQRAGLIRNIASANKILKTPGGFKAKGLASARGAGGFARNAFSLQNIGGKGGLLGIMAFFDTAGSAMDVGFMSANIAKHQMEADEARLRAQGNHAAADRMAESSRLSRMPAAIATNMQMRGATQLDKIDNSSTLQNMGREVFTAVNPIEMGAMGYSASSDTTDALDQRRQQIETNFAAQAGKAAPYLQKRYHDLSLQRQQALTNFLAHKARDHAYRSEGGWKNQLARFGHAIAPFAMDQTKFTPIGWAMGNTPFSDSGYQGANRWSTGQIRDQWTNDFLQTNPSPEAMQNYQSFMYPESIGNERDEMVQQWQNQMVETPQPQTPNFASMMNNNVIQPSVDNIRQRRKSPFSVPSVNNRSFR